MTEKYLANNVLDYYIEKYYPYVNTENEIFQVYYDTSIGMLEYSNFMLFPHKGTVKKGKENISGRIYTCDLIIKDDDFGGGFIEKKITLDQGKHLQSYQIFKTFIQLQDTKVKLEVPKKMREKYCDLVIRNMLGGFETVFGFNTGFEIESLGFTDDGNKFIFNNGILDLENGSFETNDYTLSQNVDINITYPENEVNVVNMQQCLVDLQSIEKYISSNKTISSLVLGYMIGGLFRYEYQQIKNEFPFLGMEGYTGLGKTSLSNFLSWIAGYNWKTIPVGDTEFASEVAMNSISGGFYFVDELQKVSTKMLNLMQASYNSGKSHKGGAEGDRSKIQVYKKDCSLVCFGEVLPYHDEAFLNRFLILNPTEPFLVKKLVKDTDEFQKYYEITGTNVNSEYLTTDQIKTLAIEYYRPRFMALLKNKKNIDFAYYHRIAMDLIDGTVDDRVETRLKNNLSLALTGYLILKGDSIDGDEVKSIISDYFDNLLEYRNNTILSGKVIQYIKENNGEFVSWVSKVKGISNSNPMIYVKCSNKEQGIVIQIQKLVRYVSDKLQSKLDVKHLEQQVRQLIGETNTKTRVVKVAKGEINLVGTFIPLSKVKENVYLQEIWDAVICNILQHVSELIHISEGEDKGDMYHGVQPIAKVMPNDVLGKLIEEMKETYLNAPCFSEKKCDSEIKVID